MIIFVDRSMKGEFSEISEKKFNDIQKIDLLLILICLCYNNIRSDENTLPRTNGPFKGR